MILDDANHTAQETTNQGGRTTLDVVFRRAVLRHPQTLALIDPANRESFTGNAPRRLTYAEADRMISAIAGRLRQIGLSTDTIIGVQLPNTIESVLALLGILRAGMIATPLPLLWRRADCVNALTRLGAKAIITCTRIGATDHGMQAMQIAADVFPIRYVLGFGEGLDDGIISFDDLYANANPEPLPPLERDRLGNPAAHVAVVTWDVTADGLVPVARSHTELLIGGLPLLLEGRIAQDAAILTTSPIDSFAGISLSLLPWLFAGGTLVLHQPFDAETFTAQIREHHCEMVALPGPLIPALADAGFFAPGAGVKMLLGVWRSPERLAASAPWRHDDISMIDVSVFGETAILAARRVEKGELAEGKPAPIPNATFTAPHTLPGTLKVVEFSRTMAGTVAARGPMVPRFAFPPGAERSNAPYFKVDESGYADTGYACRVEDDAHALVVTGPPAGLVSVGGYRFALRDLQNLIAQIDQAGTLAALPDAFSGHRLAGSATDHAAIQDTLTELGVNPLIVRAFRDRDEKPYVT